MKGIRKIFAVVLAVLALFSVTACTPTKESADVIYVEASLAGYRRQWLDGIVEKYEAKTGVDVEVNWDSSLSTNISTLMNLNSNMSDLYYVNLSGGTSLFTWYVQGKIESLNDVFSADNGTGKTIEQSIEKGFEGAGQYEGVRYAAYTMSGYDCLVYNPDILERAGWDKAFPNTVDEMIEMFEVINNANLKASDGTVIKPFVYMGQYSSISHLFDAFCVQYGGTEAYRAFFEHNDKSGPNRELYYAPELEVAFKNLIKFMAVGNDGIPKYVLEGSAGMSHTEAQTAFLNGYAAVCTTGTWFESEMSQIIEETDKYEIAPFPLATDDQGGFGEAEKNLIDPNGEVTPENMKKYNVRPIAGSPMFIPKKAQNKEGAKDLLKFILQEENIRYMHEQTGNQLCYEYNKENLTLTEWARKIENNNKITITGVQGGVTPIALSGALGGWQPGIWERLARTKNFNYMAEMDWRYQDVSTNWDSKMELI